MKFVICLVTWIICILPGINAWGATCTASISPASFGSYNPLSNTATDVATSISISCNTVVSLLVSYTTTLSSGSSGSIANRLMAAGSSTLQYQIYTDSARTQVWGDGTAGTTAPSNSYLLAALTTASNSLTAYGRIPPRQFLRAGNYVDTLFATIIY